MDYMTFDTLLQAVIEANIIGALVHLLQNAEFKVKKRLHGQYLMQHPVALMNKSST